MQPHNSHILEPKRLPNCFIVGDWDDIDTFYAAVHAGPKMNKLAVVHRATVLKVCRDETSARNYIKKHQKRKRKRV